MLSMLKLVAVLVSLCFVVGCDNEQHNCNSFNGDTANSQYAASKWADEEASYIMHTLERWSKNAWRNPRWCDQRYYQEGEFENHCRDTLLSELGKISQDHFRYRPIIALIYAMKMPESKRSYFQTGPRLANKLLRLEYLYHFEFRMIAHETLSNEWVTDNLYFVRNLGDDVKVISVRLGELCTYSSSPSTVVFSKGRPCLGFNGISMCMGIDFYIVDDCFRGCDDQGLSEFFDDLVEGNGSLYWGIGGKWHPYRASGKWYYEIPRGKYIFKKKAFEEWVNKHYDESVLQLRLVKTSEYEYIFSAIEKSASTYQVIPSDGPRDEVCAE